MSWEPTDEVPSTGMAAYAEPDPSLAPVTSLAAGLRLQRLEDRGAWARVAADNGWSAWVDGRLLVPLAATPAPAPTPEPAPAPAPAPAPVAAPTPEPAPAVVPAPAPAVVPAPAPVAAPAVAPGAAPVTAAVESVPGALAPSSGSSAGGGAGRGPGPLDIVAALVGIAIVGTYLLPWATFGGFSDHAFELAGDGRGAMGDFGTRTDIGIVALQALYGAIVLGPVAAVLFVARQPAARIVGILAGVAGILVVVGRLILEIPTDPDPGIGVWLGLAAAVALIALSLVAGGRRGGEPVPGPTSSW